MNRLLNLLVLSPRFPPSNAADCQRVRMLLPYLESAGCRATVLAVHPDCCANGLDPWQADHLPQSTRIVRVRGLSLRWSRLPGLGGLDARSHHALARAGDALMATERFDAVYISTTEFGTFRLGPYWQRRHRVPFILDYQDPWVNDYYRQSRLKPPGGWLKYSVVDKLNRFYEPRVLALASGYTAVSQAYPEQLVERYPFATTIPARVLPFPGSSHDIQNLQLLDHRELPFDPSDQLIHWVSIGRGGGDMQMAISGLFQAISRYAPEELKQRLRLHFIGTSYAPPGEGVPSIAPLAQRYGIAHLVQEITDRVPLSLTLACLQAADALLVLGSNDSRYTASKIYPYLLARRPLLAIMHERSSVVDLISQCGGGQCVTFNNKSSIDSLSETIFSEWLHNHQYSTTQHLNESAFEPYTALSQSRELVSFFGKCISFHG